MDTWVAIWAAYIAMGAKSMGFYLNEECLSLGFLSCPTLMSI